MSSDILIMTPDTEKTVSNRQETARKNAEGNKVSGFGGGNNCSGNSSGSNNNIGGGGNHEQLNEEDFDICATNGFSGAVLCGEEIENLMPLDYVKVELSDENTEGDGQKGCITQNRNASKKPGNDSNASVNSNGDSLKKTTSSKEENISTEQQKNFSGKR